MTALIERTRSKADRAFRFSVWVFWIGFLASVLIVALWTWLSGPEAMQRGLAAAKPWLAARRILLFVILIGGWPTWIGRLAKWAGLHERRHCEILARRWRVAAWLLVIEVLLVQGVAGEFLINLLDAR